MQRRRRGLSLVEAIIAIFILTFGFIIMARLFDAALHYEAASDAQQMAVVLANSQMDKIRAWNWATHCPANPTTVLFSDWTTVPRSPDPNFPEFNIAVAYQNAAIYSPCSQMQIAANPVGQRRVLSNTGMWVAVTVSWGGSKNTFELESLVTAPPAQLGAAMTCNFNPPLATLTETLGETLVPTVQDATGQVVPDVCFLWSFDPNDEGYGTLSNATTGMQVSLNNYLLDGNGAQIAGAYGNGNCVIDANARARGIMFSKPSKAIVIAP